jgi:RHS repeat-associated protein
MRTLEMHLELPLYKKAGRGKGTGIDFTFSNYANWPAPWVACPGGTCPFLGPSIFFGLSRAGSLTNVSSTLQCRAISGSGTYTDYVYTYVDARGNSHLFPGTARTVQESNNTCSRAGITAHGLTAQASDGSGFLIQVVQVGFGLSSGTITDPSGALLTPEYQSVSLYNSSIQDSNGNGLRASWGNDANGNITSYNLSDTVGTSISVSGGGYNTNFTNRNPLLITYRDDTGTPQTITITYKLTTLSTGSAVLADSITYPDGSAYHFTYAVVFSVIHISSITLPSGGVISYSYQTATTPCGLGSIGYIQSLTRTTTDGTTTYTQTPTSVSTTPFCAITSSWTQVIKPNGDKTNVYFVVPQHLAAYMSNNGQIITNWLFDSTKTMETKRLDYDHSNLNSPIRTSMHCYNGASGDCTSTAFNEPVTQLAVTTTLDNGQTTKVVTQYTGVSLPTEVDEYDFGASSPARKTVTTYASLGNNISDRPSSAIVYGTAGNIAKKTTYTYDEVTPAPMTLPGHTTVSGSRGNPTSVYGWIVSSGQSLRTQYTYDDAGQVTAVTDPSGNTTSFTYDSAATDAYRTKVTRPTTNLVAHVSTFGYGVNSGLVTSSHDENNQLTSYGYDLMFRPASITYPDGGQTTFSYTPTSRTTNRLQQTGVWMSQLEQLDAYGRPSRTQLTSDPDCASGDKTDTTYDSLGRVFTVSNPYCTTSDLTYGLTTYTYDALGRTTQVKNPDNSTVLTTYTGRAAQVQDEGNGTQRVTRVSQTDGLGRLTSVCEVSSTTLIGSGGTPAACGQDIAGTGFLTTYQYDALGNLLQVNQSGVNARTFAYDSLSRLTSANNPESGQICYGTVAGGTCQTNGYDANGNLVAKTDARGITTSFSYDALNRLKGKTYSDSTPTATFNYDQSSALGVTLTNTIGRRSSQSTAGPNATGSVFSYDPMGRISNNSQCTPQNCGTAVFGLQYTQYDFVGDLISATNAAGVTFTYAYNTVARLTGITTNFIDGSHPGTLFSNAHYRPFGGLTGATLGNRVTESWSYNNRLWQLSRTATFGATTPYSFSVPTFAPNGDILAANDSANGNWSYSYDPLNRLLSANATGQGYTYDYDRFGNRWHQNGPHSSQLGFDANNRITGVTGVGYDLAGNLTSDGSGVGSHTYFYNAENRLIQVDGTLGTCSTATACYVYNADGQRVRKTTGGSSMDYLYDLAGHKVAGVDPTGVFMQGELYAGGRHFATYAPAPGPTGATFFTHSDWLGTERVRTDMTGTNCESIASLPFGDGQSIIGTCGDVSPMHFTGKERDSESGLDNFEARYLGSSLGRFMSPDPMGGQQDDPQSLNRYAYVRNNPLKLTDPTGLNFNLACTGPDTLTCKGGLQGTTTTTTTTDANGNQTTTSTFTATEISNDKNGNLVDQNGNKYNGTVDGSGVHFGQQGSDASSKGIWVNNSPETKFAQTSGALAGFSFDFSQTSKQQTANGTFSFPGTPQSAYDAILRAGFSTSMADDFFNPLHGYIGSYHYRSPGDPGTGENSGHLIIRGVGPWHPWDTVPTRGDLHFGETNPNVNRIEHFTKDVF